MGVGSETPRCHFRRVAPGFQQQPQEVRWQFPGKMDLPAPSPSLLAAASESHAISQSFFPSNCPPEKKARQKPDEQRPWAGRLQGEGPPREVLPLAFARIFCHVPETNHPPPPTCTCEQRGRQLALTALVSFRHIQTDHDQIPRTPAPAQPDRPTLGRARRALRHPPGGAPAAETAAEERAGGVRPRVPLRRAPPAVGAAEARGVPGQAPLPAARPFPGCCCPAAASLGIRWPCWASTAPLAHFFFRGPNPRALLFLLFFVVFFFLRVCVVFVPPGWTPRHGVPSPKPTPTHKQVVHGQSPSSPNCTLALWWPLPPPPHRLPRLPQRTRQSPATPAITQMTRLRRSTGAAMCQMCQRSRTTIPDRRSQTMILYRRSRRTRPKSLLRGVHY